MGISEPDQIKTDGLTERNTAVGIMVSGLLPA
jgi:hypothetical protein